MRTRKLIADTIAMVLFSLAVGFFVELFISGMTLEQSIRSRITSIPANLITARPYGFYRDWLFGLLGERRKRATYAFMADTLAFCTFQVPLYAAILLSSGASIQQIATSCVTVVFISAFSGRPFGLVLEGTRRLLKVPSLR
jgi:hypothetical protein